MGPVRPPAFASALVDLVRVLEPALGPGRSTAVWALGDEARLLHASPGCPPDLVRAVERRLTGEPVSFEVQGGPGAWATVHVCGVGDERIASALFVDGSAQLHLDETIDHLIDLSEAGMGKRIADMSRTEKQQVVKFLDERGAFLIRRAVADVAERLGVTRFTIYNYLDREA
jgi:HTH domain